MSLDWTTPVCPKPITDDDVLMERAQALIDAGKAGGMVIDLVWRINQGNEEEARLDKMLSRREINMDEWDQMDSDRRSEIRSRLRELEIYLRSYPE